MIKITTLAALSNPRPIKASTTTSILLDANFYVGENEPVITAALKFFNKDNIDFTNPFTYFLRAHASFLYFFLLLNLHSNRSPKHLHK